MKRILLFPDPVDGGTPPVPTPSIGDQIGADIAAVGKVIDPIVSTLDPAVGKGVALAFRVLAVLEPAAYNAVASIISGQALTPEQEQAIADVEKALDNPDTYLNS